MKIIGINSQFDSKMNKINSGSCALIIDGKIACAFAEDRISRVKDGGGFSESLNFIFQETGLSVEDIDYFYISFYGNAIIPHKEMIKYHAKLLGIEKHINKLVVMPSHHFSHAALAYFLSPFEEAVIMIADNEGNFLYPSGEQKEKIEDVYYERNSYFWARGNCITFIERDFERPGEVGFGKAYNMFNKYIGLGNYLAVGKTMGLSSYGKDSDLTKDINVWELDEYGKLSSRILETNSTKKDVERFLIENNIPIPSRDYEFMYEQQEYKDFAYYIQKQLNRAAVQKMENLINRTGIKNICISGGVALNGIMNHEIESKLKVPVFVPPYPSDPGQALGNAIYGYITQSGAGNNSLIKKTTFKDYAYLGTEYSNDRLRKFFEENKNTYNVNYRQVKNIEKEVAKLLVQGAIIGWFQGRSEYGARALGNRSIIASPNSNDIRDRVNKLKNRELFRPLAPSVLSEFRNNFFEGERSLLDKYMLSVKKVKQNKIKLIEGVVHIDGTSRIQEVSKADNKRYYKLISEFFKLTQLPLILNTSFNIAGEPIVETPNDALRSFVKMDLDYLVCGNFIITKDNSLH